MPARIWAPSRRPSPMDWKQRRPSWPLDHKSFDVRPVSALAGSTANLPALRPWIRNQTVPRGVKRSKERADRRLPATIHLFARNTEMAIHQTPSQRKTVERVMHEFKHGDLKTAPGRRKVKNPRQAMQ